MKSVKSSSAMKWVGYATAVLSLLGVLYQIGKTVSERVENRRKVDALVSSAALQSKGQDYSSAWKTLEQASLINPDSPKVRAAQQAVAMEWLENIRVAGNEKFSDIVDKLEPVLTRRAAALKPGPQRADLLAHVGWSYFLRLREGRSGLDPAQSYAQAVKEDENNPYAQAMWGHWILWNGGPLREASQHFSSALQSNRQRDYVRLLQLSALFNRHDDEFEKEIVRVANAIRKEGGSIQPETRRRIFSAYYDQMLPAGPATAKFVTVVPPPEHVVTFQWLFGSLVPNENDAERSAVLRTYFLSVLEEAAGQRDEALEGYRRVQATASLGWGTSRGGGSMLEEAALAIKRLSPR